MKYVKEIVIIFGITMVGELLNMFIPLPVPAGVYGLFILLGGLCTKAISLSDVEVTGILIRLFPSGNNLVFSLLAGVSRIPAWPFFLGSCLGYIPQNLLFAMIGSGMRVDEGWRIGLSALLFAASCALGWWLYKRYAAAYPMGARNEH